MKKLSAALLALVSVFTFVFFAVGSGKTDGEDVTGEIITESTAPIFEPITEPIEEEPELSLGDITNNTYKNDFAGLSCTLSTGWEFYTDEQILEINNFVGNVVDDEMAEQLKNATIIYDMYANNYAEGSSINVNLEKFNASQMTNLDIKRSLESQISQIKTAYANMGYSDINIEYQKIYVDGRLLDGLKINAKIEGTDFYASVVTFRKSNYLVNVTTSSVLTDKTDVILNYFTIK